MTKYTISPDKLKVLRPVPVPIPISSGLGNRILDGKPDFHPGIDFACPVSTPIKAIADGIILHAGYENEADHLQGFGLRVWQQIQVGEKKFYVWYGHQSTLAVYENQKVKRGQVLGFSGNSGHVSPKPTAKNPEAGAHLHLQIREKDTNTLYDADWVDV